MYVDAISEALKDRSSDELVVIIHSTLLRTCGSLAWQFAPAVVSV